MDEARGLYDKAKEAFEEGKLRDALSLSEKAFNIEPENPQYQSFLGLCIGSEKGEMNKAVSLCERALQTEPQKIEHYLNLGRLYISAGLKLRAIDVLRAGLKIDGGNPEIIAELDSLGLRRAPVFRALPRNHLINKYLGIIIARLGLR